MIKRPVSPDNHLNPDILHHQIIYLNSELNKYKSKVRNYQEDYHYSQLEKLKIENDHLLEEQQRFNSRMEEINHKNLTLQNRIMEKETLIERLKKQIEKFKEEINTINYKLAQANSNNEESLKEIERHMHTNQQLQTQVSSLENELVLRSEQYTQSKKMVQKLQHSNELLSEKNKQLTTETINDKEEIKKMADQINQLQNHIITQNQKLDEYNDIHLKDKTKIQTLKNLNDKLKEEQIQLKEQKQILESFQNEIFSKIEDLKKEILSMSSGEMKDSPLQQTNIEHSKLYQQVEQIFSEINQYGEKISSCMKLTDYLEQHIDQLTDEIKQLKRKLTIHSTHP